MTQTNDHPPVKTTLVGIEESVLDIFRGSPPITQKSSKRCAYTFGTRSAAVNAQTGALMLLSHAPKRTSATIIVNGISGAVGMMGTSQSEVNDAMQIGGSQYLESVAYMTFNNKQATVMVPLRGTSELWVGATGTGGASIFVGFSAIQEYEV